MNEENETIKVNYDDDGKARFLLRSIFSLLPKRFRVLFKMHCSVDLNIDK